MSAPLISCVMPTGNRDRFVTKALEYFFRQTFERKELVIVDDGEQPVNHLCELGPSSTYIRLRRRTSLGEKLNIGIDAAKGDVLQKIDDDDYYGPRFLDSAYAALMRSPPEFIVAWDCFLIFLVGERNARFSGYGWSAGGTLCFRREVWEKAPFRHVPTREDWWFKHDNRLRVVRVRAPEEYMLVRHAANTWTHTEEGNSVDTLLRSRPPYHKPLDRVLNSSDHTFYINLAAGCEITDSYHSHTADGRGGDDTTSNTVSTPAVH